MSEEVEVVRDLRRAAALLQHPVRRRILAEARTPVSAAELAVRLGEPRQRLNYHVRQLAKHGFLRFDSRRRKRNMEEQRYVATARAYVLGPQLLGPLAATPEAAADVFSANYLLALAVQAQRELSQVTEAASAAGVRVRTLSLNTAVRFETAEQRAAFAAALSNAITTVIAQHSAPYTAADGGPGIGQPFRFVLGCYPIPPAEAEGP